MKMKFYILIATVSLLAISLGFKEQKAVKLHTIQTRNAADLKEFFSYTADRIPLVSAHRGGPREGFPENCLATFENTLKRNPAILEIDPRYTKDGKIVLMHDPTLDRTSNGKGRVIDYTLDQLQQLRLKDTKGNLTDFRIPTLDEALQWAKGKTILVIDAKDVPIDVRARRIIENKAEGNAILISYSAEDTKKCYSLYNNLLMEVMMGKTEQVEQMDKSGVPWSNIVAFVSHEIPKDTSLFAAVHQRGAMCILGSSRNYDKAYLSGKINADELKAGYLNLIAHGADVIEADLGIEGGATLRPLQQVKSSKSKYFKVKL